MRIRILAFILPLVIALLPASAQDQSILTWIDCLDRPNGFAYNDELGVICGTITVPEDWDQPDGATIEIAFSVLEGESPSTEPIIYMSGGPGEALLEAPQIFDVLFSDLRTDHDLILYDQRGSGLSHELACVRNVEGMYGYSDDAEFADMVSECFKGLLRRGFDLPEYNTVNNALDTGALMQALAEARGYTGYHLFGASYGTRLALVTMREVSSSGLIRSVTLDSVFPTQVRFYEQIPAIFQEVMWNVFARCAADPVCNREYPDLPERYLALLEAEDDPLRRMMGASSDVVESLTSNILFHLDLYPQFAAYIPRLIHETELRGEHGARDVVNAFFNSREYADASALFDVPTGSPNFSIAMNWTVQCREEAAIESLDAALDAVDDLAHPMLGQRGMSTVRNMFSVCSSWRSGAADEVFKMPVESDIPVLILLGDFDVRTPPSWGRAAAETLSHATVLEFDASGHFVVGWNECALDVFGAFIADPLAELDASCVGGVATKFVLPDALLDMTSPYDDF